MAQLPEEARASQLKAVDDARAIKNCKQAELDGAIETIERKWAERIVIARAAVDKVQALQRRSTEKLERATKRKCDAQEAAAKAMQTDVLRNAAKRACPAPQQAEQQPQPQPQPQPDQLEQQPPEQQEPLEPLEEDVPGSAADVMAAADLDAGGDSGGIDLEGEASPAPEYTEADDAADAAAEAAAFAATRAALAAEM